MFHRMALALLVTACAAPPPRPVPVDATPKPAGVEPTSAPAASPSPPSGGPPPSRVTAWCEGEGPAKRHAVAMKDATGTVGAYRLSQAILDSPVVYLKPDGGDLTVFHIFDDDAARAAAGAIVDDLRARYPLEEALC
jgi:hypothetical protein